MNELADCPAGTGTKASQGLVHVQYRIHSMRTYLRYKGILAGTLMSAHETLSNYCALINYCAMCTGQTLEL